MEPAGWIILAVIVAAVVAIVWMARRRKWNADGSDDRRRERERP